MVPTPRAEELAPSCGARRPLTSRVGILQQGGESEARSGRSVYGYLPHSQSDLVATLSRRVANGASTRTPLTAGSGQLESKGTG